MMLRLAIILMLAVSCGDEMAGDCESCNTVEQDPITEACLAIADFYARCSIPRENEPYEAMVLRFFLACVDQIDSDNPECLGRQSPPVPI